MDLGDIRSSCGPSRMHGSQPTLTACSRSEAGRPVDPTPHRNEVEDERTDLPQEAMLSRAPTAEGSLFAELLTRSGAIQAAMLCDILAGRQHKTIEQYRIAMYGR